MRILIYKYISSDGTSLVNIGMLVVNKQVLLWQFKGGIVMKNFKPNSFDLFFLPVWLTINHRNLNCQSESGYNYC